MEFELLRHDWEALQGPHGGTQRLPQAIRDLHAAVDESTAAEAAQRIDQIVFANDLLSQVSPALASCLVHCVWTCSGSGLGHALGLLADICGGSASESDPNVFGPVTWEECMAEIVTGFPVFAEILETGQDRASLVSCIDLLMMCGLYEPRLRDRARHYLRLAFDQPELAEHRGLIVDSLAELSATEPDVGTDEE